MGVQFPVYAGEGEVQPLLGSYVVEDHVLTFHPRFPVTAGVHYHAIFKGAGAEPLQGLFTGHRAQPIR